MRRSLAALIAVLGMTFSGLAGPPSGGAVDRGAHTRASDELRLYGPAAQPQGHRWRLWAARYLEWLQEIPVGRNPAVHPDSRHNCELQHRVVMMAPYGTGEGCEVPSDTAILLTFNAWSCSTAEGNGRTWRQLRRCARESFQQELSDIRVRFFLDGELVRHPARWMVDSARGVADLPEKNTGGHRRDRRGHWARGCSS